MAEECIIKSDFAVKIPEKLNSIQASSISCT